MFEWLEEIVTSFKSIVPKPPTTYVLIRSTKNGGIETILSDKVFSFSETQKVQIIAFLKNAHDRMKKSHEGIDAKDILDA